MEQRPEDLHGMDTAAAKEYVAAHIASLKLTEKKLAELDAEILKWEGRIELAASKGESELAAHAEAEAARRRQDRETLASEAAELRAMIERMRVQLPGLAAAERSIDPDLLEQELRIAAGRLPGDDVSAETEKKIADMERNQAAEAALAALKEKMKGESPL